MHFRPSGLIKHIMNAMYKALRLQYNSSDLWSFHVSSQSNMTNDPYPLKSFGSHIALKYYSMANSWHVCNSYTPLYRDF